MTFYFHINRRIIKSDSDFLDNMSPDPYYRGNGAARWRQNRLSMTSDSPKELRYVWYTVILVLVIQIAGLAYMRKKFDDNILILQSSENAMNMKVESIELMLLKMKEAGNVPVAVPKVISEKKTETVVPAKESTNKEDSDKQAAEKE